MQRTELAEQWVAALRSGDYRQGRGRLCTHDGGYCCLGVAAEIAGELLRDEASPSWRYVDDPTDPASNRNSFTLSPALLDRLGITEDEQSQLTWLNDYDHASFARIADYIEARWE